MTFGNPYKFVLLLAAIVYMVGLYTSVTVWHAFICLFFFLFFSLRTIQEIFKVK